MQPSQHYQEIPDFLKVTPEEAEKRVEYNRTHPVVFVAFMQVATPQGTPTVTAEELERRAVEQREREKQASYARLNAMNDKKMLARKDKRWDNGRWVDVDGMSRSKLSCLLRDMPSDEHRAILMRKYGARFPGVVAAPPLERIVKPAPVVLSTPAAKGKKRR